MTIIVPETPDHYDAIRQLTVAAFAASELGYNGEADLIDALRANAPGLLGLVALVAEEVVGHILFSPATIQSESALLHGTALAPIAVLPAQQRRGIGTELITQGLRRLDDCDTDFVIVAGHPAYYPRFGFLPAHALRITHGFLGMPQEILFLRPHSRLGTAFPNGGRAYFHAAFGEQYGG
jgi:putative acetyltransferase